MKKTTLLIICLVVCSNCGAQQKSDESLQFPASTHHCAGSKNDNVFDLDHAMRHIREITNDPLKQDSLLIAARQRFEIITHRKDVIHSKSNTQENKLKTNKTPSFDCAANNWNFEQGDFSGWTTTGNVYMINSGSDPYGNYPWVYPGGGNNSVKISGDRNEEANGSISREILVPDSGVTYFSFHFAMSIFNYPHYAYEAAKFRVEFFDQNDNILPCPNFLCYYSIDEGAQGVPGFQQTAGPALDYNPNANGAGPEAYPVTYSSWNDVTLDLSLYAGQTITAKFTADWCIYGPDWCYALLDVDCPLNNLEPIIECGTYPHSICGPPDMATYHWLDINNNEIGNTECIPIQSPGEYFCKSLPQQVDCTPGTEVTFHYTALENPVSEFSITDASICPNTLTSFMDQSYSNTGQVIQEWEWDFGNNTSASDQNPEVLFSQSGDFEVKLTAFIDGCSATSAQIVHVHSIPTALFSTETTCDGESILLSDQSSSGEGTITSQEWDLGGDGSMDAYGTNPLITVPDAGDYSIALNVTDSNNCTNTSSANVTVYPILEANIEYLTSYNGYHVSCFGYSDGVFAVHPSGGNGDFNLFSADVNIAPDAPVENLPAGYYAIQITDSRGCSSAEIASLIEPLPLTQQLSVISDYYGSDITCYGNADGQATTSINGGVAPFDILWNDMSTEANSFTDLGEGLAESLVTDANGCISVESIFVEQPDPVQIQLVSITSYNGFDISCNGLHDGEVTLSAQGGTGAIYYTWDGAFGSGHKTNLSAGLHTTTVTDLNGCVAELEYELQEPEVLECNTIITSDYNGYSVPCPGLSNGTAAASANGGVGPYQFIWSNNEAAPINQSLSVNDSWVKIYDANNCLTSCSFEVTEPTAIQCNFNIISDTCQLEVGRIEALPSGGVPGYATEWTYQSQNMNQSQLYLEQLPKGQYALTLTDANGCEKFFEMDVNEIPAANISLNLSPTPFCSDIPITFSVGSDKNILQWNWIFDNGTASTMAEPTVEFLDEGIHQVELAVVDEHHCPVEETFEFDLQLALTLYIPNSFTPNNDGINDVFGAEGLGIDEFEMKIYDRWGEVIFESHDLAERWTGNFKGGDYFTEIGVYHYVVKVSGTCTETKELVGDVLLVR
jgi:gliding motility-associated-like protein